MMLGSYKDVVRWFKRPLLRATLMVAGMSYALWKALLWALAPGFWGGSWMYSVGASPLTLARERFGPILLVKWWITDPAGSNGGNSYALDLWGQYESAARLILIIGTLWIVICTGIMFPRIKHALQARQQRSKAGT